MALVAFKGQKRNWIPLGNYVFAAPPEELEYIHEADVF